MASIYVRNKNRTPSQEAPAEGHRDGIELLLEHGAQEEGRIDFANDILCLGVQFVSSLPYKYDTARTGHGL